MGTSAAQSKLLHFGVNQIVRDWRKAPDSLVFFGPAINPGDLKGKGVYLLLSA